MDTFKSVRNIGLNWSCHLLLGLPIFIIPLEVSFSLYFAAFFYFCPLATSVSFLEKKNFQAFPRKGFYGLHGKFHQKHQLERNFVVRLQIRKLIRNKPSWSGKLKAKIVNTLQFLFVLFSELCTAGLNCDWLVPLLCLKPWEQSFCTQMEFNQISHPKNWESYTANGVFGWLVCLRNCIGFWGYLECLRRMMIIHGEMERTGEDYVLAWAGAPARLGQALREDYISSWFVLGARLSHRRPQNLGTIFFHVGFEVFTAVVTKSSIFWDITRCSPLKSIDVSE
jgi:hypothetical protein